MSARTDALVVVGCITPVGVLVGWRALHTLERRVGVRDADVDLLQRVPMLRRLPEVTIEHLAAGLSLGGATGRGDGVRAGRRGSDFYVIEGGQASVVGDGRPIRTLGQGDGFGEIALLRKCRRTATFARARILNDSRHVTRRREISSNGTDEAGVLSS